MDVGRTLGHRPAILSELAKAVKRGRSTCRSSARASFSHRFGRPDMPPAGERAWRVELVRAALRDRP